MFTRFDVLHAETLALFWGIQEALRHHFLEVAFEYDSQLLVQEITTIYFLRTIILAFLLMQFVFSYPIFSLILFSTWRDELIVKSSSCYLGRFDWDSLPSLLVVFGDCRLILNDTHAL